MDINGGHALLLQAAMHKRGLLAMKKARQQQQTEKKQSQWDDKLQEIIKEGHLIKAKLKLNRAGRRVEGEGQNKLTIKECAALIYTAKKEPPFSLSGVSLTALTTKVSKLLTEDPTFCPLQAVGGNVEPWVQCEACEVWHTLPPGTDVGSLPDSWKCGDAPLTNTKCQPKPLPAAATVGAAPGT